VASGIFSDSGSTDKTQAFLKKMQTSEVYLGLESLAQQGVSALASMTPVDSGLTAASWTYEIKSDGSKVTISWSNYNRNNGTLVAIILQYGHATGTGGFVSGQDYINPAIQPIFDQISSEVWKRVTLA
jgi:hypothetical protein